MDLLSNAYISTHFSAHGATGQKAAMLEAYEFGVAKQIFEKLWTVYPGYDWKVVVNATGGICSIKLPRLHHSTLGYNFPLDKLLNDPDLSIVKRAGGEILERFKLTRGKVNKAEYVDKIRARPFAFRFQDKIDGGLAIENTAKYVHGQASWIRP